MSLILNIDTAIETAYISIAKDGIILEEACNKDQKDHGAFLQPAIQIIARQAGISLNELDAISVVSGPGSYTGLRVGMASAKGLCYALNKPLITVDTLLLLTVQAIKEIGENDTDKDTLFCPMIDARRMEVFTTIYTNSLNMELLPSAMIINENSFENFLLNNKIIFFGNGAAKCSGILNNKNAHFINFNYKSLYMSILANQKFSNNQFSELAYTEPFYVKEFYNSNIL